MSIIVAVLIVIASVWMDLPPRVSSRDEFRNGLAVFLSIEAAIIILLGSGVYAARDMYEAALPLDGRDIWVSRLVALLCVVWLPVPIGIIGGLPPLTLSAGASVTTLLILCAKCFRIRELGAPKWLRDNIARAVLIIPACYAFWGRALRSVHWPALPAAWSVLATTGLVSIFLFYYGWQSVPQSFIIAPLDVDASARSDGENRPKPVWTPLFRSIYQPSSMLLLFGFVVSSMAYGTFGIAVLAVIPLSGISANSRWLLALPVSRRMLFALVAAAPTLAVTIGEIASALFAHRGPRTMPDRLADLAAELALAYFALFLLELPGWRALSRLRTWVKWVPFGIAFFTLPLFNAGNVVYIHAQEWPLFFLLPAAAYWLAEKAFIEQEYPRSLIPTNQHRSF